MSKLAGEQQAFAAGGDPIVLPHRMGVRSDGQELRPDHAASDARA